MLTTVSNIKNRDNEKNNPPV